MIKTALPDGLEWQDWRRERGELFQAVAMEKRMMGLMLVLIIAVATFNILSALVMVVTDKEGEVAILRTMGMNESGIVKIFMVLGASSGVIGALLGGLTGLALSLGLNPLLDAVGLNLYMTAGGSGLPVIVEPTQVITILLGAVLLSFSATLYPAARAARVNRPRRCVMNNSSSVVTSGEITGVSGAPFMNEPLSSEPLLRCQALNHVYQEGELETQVLKGLI